MMFRVHRYPFRVGLHMYGYGVIVRFPGRRRIYVIGKDWGMMPSSHSQENTSIH